MIKSFNEYFILDELEVLKTVSVRLNELKLNYMISGSVALNFYTEPRMTRDIDIILEIKKRNVEDFADLFEGDFYVDKEMIYYAIKNGTKFNIISIKNVVKIDFIVKRNDEYSKLEFNRRIKAAINNIELYLTSIEDLIISKLVWTSDRYSEIQIKDINNLLNNEIDMDYIKKWSKIMGIEDILNKALNYE